MHWHWFAALSCGDRKLKLHILLFKILLMWLTHVAEQTFGFMTASWPSAQLGNLELLNLYTRIHSGIVSKGYKRKRI